MPRPSKLAAAHFRADENGTLPVNCHPGGGLPTASMMAARVALGAGSAEASAASAPVASVSVVDPSGSTRSKEMSPVVIVPVLSRHRVSTRASSSTDASSRASALRRARATTPVMNDKLVSSTRPSGTMATAAATVPRSASCQRSSVASSLPRSSTVASGMIHVRRRRITLTPPLSSLPASLNRRASSARRAA